MLSMCLFVIFVFSQRTVYSSFAHCLTGLSLYWWVVRVLYIFQIQAPDYQLHNLQKISPILWVVFLFFSLYSLKHIHFLFWWSPVYLFFVLLLELLVSCLRNHYLKQGCEFLALDLARCSILCYFYKQCKIGINVIF